MGLLSRIGIQPRASGSSGYSRPADWLIEALGGSSTAAGVRVSETTALNISAVWACVRLVSETVASLPLIVYSGDGDDKERARDHRVYRLLHDAPNPAMTSMVFRETLQAHVETWGNGYAEILRNGSGEPVELWPTSPQYVTPVVEKGRLYYVYQPPSGRRVIQPENILHIPGLSFDGLIGYSPVRMARESLGVTVAAEKFGGKFFANGVRAGGVMMYPGNLSQKAKDNLEASLEKHRTGVDNAHKTLILEEGIKWQQTTIPPEEAQFLESRKFQVEEIARWWNVPPHKIKHLERSTFSNIEHQSIEFVQDSIRPRLIRWEQEIKRKLLSTEPGYYAEHLVDGLLRGATKDRYDAYNVGRQGGWLSANDIRRMENMPAIEGGDKYLVPLNMQPADSAGDAQALRRAAALRVVRAEVNQWRRDVKNQTHGDYEAWALDFYPKHMQWAAKVLNCDPIKLVQVYEQELPPPADIDDAWQKQRAGEILEAIQ